MIFKKSRGNNQQLVYTLLILLLSLTLIQTIHVIQAQTISQNNQWALSFQIRNGQNSTSTTFNPFDQIQLFAQVTYGNATQPDILVTFKVQSPSNSPNAMNITRITATNANGDAECSFQLPMYGENQDSLIGTWQASATIQTTNGTIQNSLQKNLTFTTLWNLEIASINIQNAQGQNQSIFYPGNTIAVQLSINNHGPSQTANITINLKDSTGKIINQTQIPNKQIDTTNPTQIPANIQIPSNATLGEASITAAIFSRTLQNIDIPAAQNKTSYFAIATNTAPTTTSTPTSPPPPSENTVTLFSWVLVATGFFTFTILFIFLKRKPMPKIGTQMPNIPSPTPSQTTNSPAQPSSPATLTAKIASEKIINATMDAQETLEILMPQSISAQEQKQLIVNYLTKISSTSERVQALEAELKIEKEQLNKEITGLTKTLEEQERAVQNYFESIRKEIAKLTANISEKNAVPTLLKKTNQRSVDKTEEESKKD